MFLVLRRLKKNMKNVKHWKDVGEKTWNSKKNLDCFILMLLVIELLVLNDLWWNKQRGYEWNIRWSNSRYRWRRQTAFWRLSKFDMFWKIKHEEIHPHMINLKFYAWNFMEMGDLLN